MAGSASRSPLAGLNQPLVERGRPGSTRLRYSAAAMTIKSLIRTIPHYPKHGIMFRDITTLLKDGVGFSLAIESLARRYEHARPDKIAGIESRGFIVGA